MSAKPTAPRHELVILPFVTPLGGTMKQAGCVCGWRSESHWYGEIFVKQDYDQHVREVLR